MSFVAMKYFNKAFYIFLFLLLSGIGKSQKSTVTNLIGTISGSLTSPIQSFTWVISPLTSISKIQLIFEYVDVEIAELRIADTSRLTDGVFLWSCSRCGSFIPPPFYSTTSSVTITITGISGIAFVPSLFIVKYIGIPFATSFIPLNVSINLNLGYSTIAPIQSTVDKALPLNSVQTWKIKQALTTPGSNGIITPQIITFMFSQLSLHSKMDQLLVYDDLNNRGRLIFNSSTRGSLTIAPKTWFYSMTGKAYVIFRIGSSPSSTPGLIASSSYFELTYTIDNIPVFNCGSFLDPALLTGSTMIINDGSGLNNLMRRGASCQWKISPLVSRTDLSLYPLEKEDPTIISLIFTQISLMYGSAVVIYDIPSTSVALNNPTDYPILYNGIGATLTIPPIITSSPGNNLDYSSLLVTRKNHP
jgi:hypothetical protein